MKKWINNGIVETCVVITDNLPNGFVLGRLHKKTKIELLSIKIDKQTLYDYYCKHSKNDTANYFNVSVRDITKLLSYYNIVKPKDCISYTNKGRSHESYLQGGIKSGETQKLKWQNMPDEERLSWSEKQKKAHNTEHFKSVISKINKEYRASLSDEQKQRDNSRRSESCKVWWYNNMTQEERREWIKTSLSHGAGWNHKLIGGSNSKPNLLFDKLLSNNLIEHEREYRLDKYSYDFKVDNVLIEINPTATHNSTFNIFKKAPLDKDYHYKKSLIAKEHGFRCIHIFDWDNTDKIINSLKSDKTFLYARKCVLKEISSTEANNFIKQYHYQGNVKAEVYIGLYYNDELISVMSFGKPRYNKNYEWELLRYCSRFGFYTVGGAEKLFNYFIKTYNPNSIISYCDFSKFSGNVYERLGFKYKSFSISKHWFNPITNKHITDNLLRQRGFDQLFGTDYGKGTSNEQLMLNNGFVEIYDAGQYTYVFNKKQ